MLALIYLVLMILLGDAICRRVFVCVSTPHRWAMAVLVGMLVGGWGTYLCALAFSWTPSPLLLGNILFAVLAGGSIWFFRGNTESSSERSSRLFDKWDWILIGIFLLFTSWMMFATFKVSGGLLQIGFHEYSDFSAIVATIQSFAEGANFPTQSPIFAGDRIRSYFLFYFLAGDLGYLGLNPALSLNILSVLSTTAMLGLVMTLGRVLVDSKAAGRIGAVLFFFLGSLSFMPFLSSQTSMSGLIDKLTAMTAFLNSGLGHRGEDWGIWSQNVFLTQRNLAGSIGILLIVLIVVITRYRQKEQIAEPSAARETNETTEDQQEPAAAPVAAKASIAPYIFCGLLLGLMGIWNGAVLVDALLLFTVLLIAFPLRREMLLMLVVAVALAVPQMIYIQMGARTAAYSYFHWGYLLDSPSVLTLLYYLLFTFGFKWLLMGLGNAFAGSFQRRFFAAVSVLLVFAFTTRFTEELLNNHKLFNIWLIIANVYVAYGLVRLWQLNISWARIPARVLAVMLTLLVTLSGAIDLMPIRNASYIEMKYSDDRLIEWVRNNTDARAVFLSHRHTHHPLLLAGRPSFFAAPYYAWEAGHKTVEREAVYRRMFESTDAAEVLRLLREHNIKYVAIDEAIRSGREFIKQHNEAVYQASCKVVFEDTENRYGSIKIYEVP